MLCLSTWWRRTVAASYSTIAVTHKMINDVMYVDDSRVEWAQIWCLDMQQYRLDNSSSRIPGMKPYNELSIWLSIAQNSMTFWWLTAFVCLACDYKRRLSIIFVLFPIQINFDWYMLECFKCIIGGHCIMHYIVTSSYRAYIFRVNASARTITGEMRCKFANAIWCCSKLSWKLILCNYYCMDR